MSRTVGDALDVDLPGLLESLGRVLRDLVVIDTPRLVHIAHLFEVNVPVGLALASSSSKHHPNQETT